jgi:alkylation response protein AidB-like acyl-CoA dehydrogenase
MDFSYTEEQNLLRDSVERFLDKNYTFEQRRASLGAHQGMSTATWEGLASLGLLGLSFSADYGGYGGSGIETMIVMESFGRHLVLEPYLSTVVLCASAIELAGDDQQKNTLLPRIADGSMRFALALCEPGARFDFAYVETTAHQEGGQWIINGKKSVVIHGAAADLLVVPVRTSGKPSDRTGISLLFVNPAEEGVVGRDYPTYDGMRAAEVEFNNVHVEPESVIGVLDAAYPLLEKIVDRGIAALCAEAVGCMDALNRQTLEYLKTRQQFGVPIGKFQALQHRMVDMRMEYEMAKSMATLAAVKVDDTDTVERPRAVSAAKERIGRAARFVGQQAIQLHGGMGMTDELPIGHYFKRLTAIDTMFGNSDYHLDRFWLAERASMVEAPVRLKSRWKTL